MKKINLLLMLFFFLNCDSEKATNDFNNQSSYKIVIGNSTYSAEVNHQILNENCGFIFGEIWLNDQYVIELKISQEGYLSYFIVNEVNGSFSRLKTLDFNPLSEVEISSFELDLANKKASIKISGKLKNVVNQQELNFSAELTENNLPILNCNATLMRNSSKINSHDFRNTINYSIKNNQNQSKYFAFSDNGYAIIMSTATPLSNLTTNTTYFFDENSPIKFNVLKFIGPNRSSNLITFNILDNEWSRYFCRGSFLLNEINDNFISGTYQFNAFEMFNEELIYNVDNGEFLFIN